MSVSPAEAGGADEAASGRVGSLLAAARARLHRLTPAEAAARQRAGALLVDTRPIAQRTSEGEIPGSVVLERNVLEWRLDPTSGAALAEAASDRDIVLFCDEGYASSLAAASLLDLGLHATDVVGGFRRWRAEGLPVVPGGTPTGSRTPRLRPPRLGPTGPYPRGDDRDGGGCGGQGTRQCHRGLERRTQSRRPGA